MEPTAAQLAVRNASDPGLLILAPAGCGKTEALALRAAGLLEQGLVEAPRKVLVATFTNRARDNIRERLRTHLRPGDFRDCVTVQNFHGLAARIFRAHANVIGMDPDMTMPDRDWVGDQCRLHRLSYDTAKRVQDVLREIKQEARDDDAVLAALARHPTARAIEERRRQENRLTYNDLLRCAELILQNEAVAGLYQNHFSCLVVDEFQDLTPQQLRIVQRIGHGRTTYAGDMAQGIYGFAGADPVSVKASIEAEVTHTITFAESHRSSPTVLAMVNALSSVTGGQALTCARPDSWPGGGVAARVRFTSAEREARWALELACQILAQAPGHRVAVIARSKPRRRFVDQLVTGIAGVECYRWDDPVLDTQTAPLLRSALHRATATGFNRAKDQMTYLWHLAQGEEVQDPDTREFLIDAIGWAVDLLSEGESPRSVAARIKVGDSGTLLTMPGIHLLTGHVGKGQQFDWVIIIGLEDGCLPDFRVTTARGLAEEARILSVMLSRARHGVVLSWAQQVPDQRGVVREKERTRYLSYFDTVGECRDGAGLRQWLEIVDWAAIASRTDLHRWRCGPTR
jgi:DNA helicase-2/ATP-dependent DNA helicase PcrA